MSPRKKIPPALDELRTAARTLSSMLADAVADARQRQQGGEEGGNRELKELTAVLKDVTAVVKTLEPDQAARQTAGVVILPEVKLHEPED